MDGRPEPVSAIDGLRLQRFPTALAVFCAGSVIRGEGTPHSDLDVVVLVDSIPSARRESFLLHGWPIELFVHDLQTLAYFVRLDCNAYRPSLLSMLVDAVVVPAPSVLSERLKRWASRLLQHPPPLSEKERADARYLVTDLLDDLRDPRPNAELMAIASKLYTALGAFILKTNGQWDAAGKHLPRALNAFDPAMAAAFEAAFEHVFRRCDPVPLITFTEAMLKPFGGPLFDGYRSDAPAEWRTPCPDFDP